MNKLNYPDPTNGIRVYFEDLEYFLGLGSYDSGIYQYLQDYLKNWGTDFIVYGCTDLGGGVTGDGWIMLSGELIRVKQHSRTGTYFAKITETNATGDREDSLSNSINVWLQNRATVSASSGTLTYTGNNLLTLMFNNWAASTAEHEALSTTTKFATPGGISNLIADVSEHNALTVTDRFCVPGRLPEASESQVGLIEIANDTETEACSDGTIALSPSRLGQFIRPKGDRITSNSTTYSLTSNPAVGSVYIAHNISNVTISLPSPSSSEGREIFIYAEGTTSNCVVSGTGIPIFPGNVIDSNYMYILSCNGSKWFKSKVVQMENAEGLACPYVYVNGKYFDEILKNIRDVDGQETVDITNVLRPGVNKITISEEKAEVTYMKKLYFNGNLIAENLILHEGDKHQFEINHNSDIGLLTAVGHYVNV